MQRIQPCLWFDHDAERAARFYVGVFPNSRIVATTRYGEAGRQVGREPGTVLTVQFELDGQPHTALNGGPEFRFNEAISLQVMCSTQEEVDYYWAKLADGGDPRAQQCGWLKDKFGVSWQVVPEAVLAMLTDKDPARAERVFNAIMPMKKLDIAALEREYRG